jgi:hypothetical protein
MRKYLLAGIFLFVAAVPAGSETIPGRFAACKVLDECLGALDAIAAQRTGGWGSDLDKQFAARLESFGRPAKLELLKRAAGDDRGWRNLAGSILMYWQSFDLADAPALIDALHREPGGWAARPLGRIGTPGIVAVLADDVRQHGADNQSGWVLSQAGDQVFAYILPLLSDDKQWHSAATILREMKSNAMHGLGDWLTIALDSKKPERDRVGALRGIGILGTSARDVAPKLRPLLAINDGDGPIPETARQVLMAMGDEAVASWTISACRPSTDPFDGSFESTQCFERAAVYANAVLPDANTIFSSLAESRAGADRAIGASLVGFVGYAPARQRLIELLKDNDWRVVYATARSLGWLKAREAIPALTLVAKNHWLPDVLAEAAAVVSVLRSAGAAAPRPEARPGTLGFQPDVPLEVDATFAPDIAPCASGTWTWQGHAFREPDDVAMTLQIGAHGARPAGSLVGRDRGEWGGDVTWKTASQAPSIVATGNVEGLARAGEDIIAVIGGWGVWTAYDDKRASNSGDPGQLVMISNGAGGSGYALALHRDASGAWRVRETARFPRTAFGLKSIGDGLFAVWSGNRAIVFNTTAILGLAQCVAK